jgi:RHH-type proline utilization regulon transcriptional repressor/proline dehydrogenase/delta 1-pyrroline-5-carboxylate dehydrogenase
MTGQNDRLSPLVLTLPTITSITLSSSNIEWTVYGDRVFLEYSDQDALKSALEPFLHVELPALRSQVDVASTPFLAGVFPSEREVRLYSPRLSQELFLIEALEQSGNEILESKSYQIFKHHTEKVAALRAQDFPSVHDVVTRAHELPDLANDQRAISANKRAGELTGELLKHLNAYRPSPFEQVSDFALGLTAKYALLRVHLLKFLAILPSLDHDKQGHEVKRILLEALRRLLFDNQRARKASRRKGDQRVLPKFYVSALKLAHAVSYLCPAGILAWSVRTKVRFMAKRFIAGETIELAQDSFNGLFGTGRDVTLDQLGELVVSEREADHYMEQVLKLVEGFKAYIAPGEKNGANVNRAHVSIKVSALCSDFRAEAFEATYNLVAPRLIKILTTAKKAQVFINIDAEHYHYRDLVFQIYRKALLSTPELADYAATGIVIQAYLRDGAAHLKEVIALAKERGLTMPVRLVKGAYWDAETVEADAHSFDAPEFLNKEETDLHFRQLVIGILEAHPHLTLCLASHNFADHAWARALKETAFESLPPIEHQCLHMTYEALSVGIAKMGWPVRNYVPVGSLLVGMAYLVRRIMENSSQVGVLTMMRSHKKKTRMVSPEEIHQRKKEQGSLFRDLTQVGLTSTFFNVTPVRPYLREHLDVFTKALAKRRSELGHIYPNSFLVTGAEVDVMSSSSPNLVVGKLRYASREDVDRALGTLTSFYSEGPWATSDWQVRANTLIAAANLMLLKRLELAALIVYEAGKTALEALGDVDEAIDFLNFYAREEGKENARRRGTPSRGVVAAITPWNFPLAIPCGMVSGPLVAGNVVVLKSSEQSPLISQALVDILHEAGVPKEALIHLPGEGEIVGDAIVSDSRVAVAVFTGSKAVGMLIQHKMASRVYTNPLTGQQYPARAITEMGGKNAIIVTANAELDETVSGILASSLSHAGQKCSAASRVLVDNSVKERLVERLKEAMLDVVVGEAFNFSTAVNPVISAEDKERLQDAVAKASEEARAHNGRVLVDRTQEKLPGHCIGPALIELPIERAYVEESYARTELFGPVVHVMGVKDLDQAIHAFNTTEYALTGGIFSQSQDDVDHALMRMESGNIYVNRGITGARVGIEPFGGFKLSGTGPKAGGKAYVRAFHVEPMTPDWRPSLFEEGSEYRFDLCTPSRLRARNRAQIIDSALTGVLHNFEALFQGIYGENKKTLGLFQKWVRTELVHYLSGHMPNRRIPGQLSYNDNRLATEHVLVVASTELPLFATLMQVLAAMSTGAGVTVAARNQKAFEWWGSIHGMFRRAGMPKENFDVYFANEAQVKEKLKAPPLSFIISDAGPEVWPALLETIYDGKYDEMRLKHLLTAQDGPFEGNFRSLCGIFTWTRSFAINTMRHGAPLDLELSS